MPESRPFPKARQGLDLRRRANAHEKMCSRMFRERLEGFTAGLSAENHPELTETSRATAPGICWILQRWDCSLPPERTPS
jgi:hypothetical protein